MLNRAAFDDLVRARGQALVSIYLPTHSAGPDTRQDPIRLKNLATQLRRTARERDLVQEVEQALDPVDALLEDLEFWRHGREGLALFGGDGRPLAIHRLPVRVEEYAELGPRFNVRPLLPAVSDGRRFHLLALSQNDVRLWECSRGSARELPRGAIPKSLVDALGGDYEETSLQHHATTPKGARGRPDAMFHGQGRGKDDEEDDLRRFLHRVDDGVLEELPMDRPLPLVVAAVEDVVALYRSLSKHPRLVPDGVHGNPEQRDIDELLPAALEVARPVLDAGHHEQLERGAAAAGSDQALDDLPRIVEAARNGRVDSLLARCDEPVWGTPSAQDEPGEAREQVDLLDLALHHAHATGAHLEPVSAEELPDTPARAVLRY